MTTQWSYFRTRKAPVRGLTTTEIDTKGLLCHAMQSRHVVRELLKISCDILPHQKRKKHWAEKALDNLIVYKFSLTRVAFLPYTRLYIQTTLCFGQTYWYGASTLLNFMDTKFEPVLTWTATVWVRGQWNALHR